MRLSTHINSICDRAWKATWFLSDLRARYAPPLLQALSGRKPSSGTHRQLTSQFKLTNLHQNILDTRSVALSSFSQFSRLKSFWHSNLVLITTHLNPRRCKAHFSNVEARPIDTIIYQPLALLPPLWIFIVKFEHESPLICGLSEFLYISTSSQFSKALVFDREKTFFCFFRLNAITSSHAC